MTYGKNLGTSAVYKKTMNKQKHSRTSDEGKHEKLSQLMNLFLEVILSH